MVWEITVENEFKPEGEKGKKVKANGGANGSVIEIDSAPETFSLQPGETLTICAVFDNPNNKKDQYWVKCTKWIADADCFKKGGDIVDGPYPFPPDEKYIIKEKEDNGTSRWSVEIQCPDVAAEEEKSGNVTVGDDQ
jgi:hypothetical protein